MTVRAVLFDLDCTLTDRRRSIARAAELFARTYKLPTNVSIDLLDAVMRRADWWGYRDRREFFNEIIGAIGWQNPAEMNELLRFWADDHPTCTVARENAYDVLRALRKAAIRTAIVTNGDVRTQAAKIRQLRLGDEVDAVVISGTLGISKPDPRIFGHALAQIGVEAKHALFVGDHPENDIAGSAGAGLRSVWISGTGEFPADQPAPWRSIEQLNEVLDLAGVSATASSTSQRFPR